MISYDGRFRVEIFYDADFPYKLDSLRKVVEALQPNSQLWNLLYAFFPHWSIGIF